MHVNINVRDIKYVGKCTRQLLFQTTLDGQILLSLDMKKHVIEINGYK